MQYFILFCLLFYIFKESPILPPLVSHFDEEGKPNGTTSVKTAEQEYVPYIIIRAHKEAVSSVGYSACLEIQGSRDQQPVSPNFLGATFLFVS